MNHKLIQLTSRSGLIILIFALTACARDNADKASGVASGEDDATSFAAESAVGVVSGALNDGEQSPSYAQVQPRLDFEKIFIQKAYAASCGLNRFYPAIGSSDCSASSDGKSIQANFDSCTVGPSDQFKIDGKVLLAFDSASTCGVWIRGAGLPTSGSLLRTTSNLVRINPNGSKVSTSSDVATNFLGESVSGGVKVSFGASTRTIDVLGIHRVRTRPNGALGFDHTIKTLVPIVVTGTRNSANRQIQSGQIRVDHNRAKYSMTASFAGLTWSSTCCHPTQGSVNFEMSGSLNGKLEMSYNTGVCGEAIATRDGQSQKIELASCE